MYNLKKRVDETEQAGHDDTELGGALQTRLGTFP